MPKRRCSSPLEEEDFRDASDILVQDAAIFDPAIYEPLIRIINELDPASFLKFSTACRAMNHLCFFSKGIEVRLGGNSRGNSPPLPESWMDLSIEIEDDESNPDGIRFVLKRFDNNFTFSEELLEKVLQMPFRFVIADVCSFREHELNSRQMMALGHFLRRFRRIEIGTFMMLSGTTDWNMFAGLVKEFRVKDVDIADEVDTPIPHDLLVFFATNLLRFEYENYVPDDVILATTAEELALFKSSISVYTFKNLLRKYAAGEITNWVVGRQLSDIDFEQGTDPFRTACSEVMKVVQVENAEAVDKEPGVLYWNPPHSGIFHMMKNDGSNGRLEIEHGCLVFGVWEL